ncbi:MAG: hypothetical protein WA510_08110 [Acidobacteriaceae bacterium]
MNHVAFRGRKAAQIESDDLRLTVTQEGGHVAELMHKKTNISPLWIPKWPSIEPSTYSPALHPEYGEGAEAQLLAGIFGHNICLDLFGGPDAEEAMAGRTVHGEGPIAHYRITGDAQSLLLHTDLAKAEMTFERRIELAGGGVVAFSETIHNYSPTDRPIGWTQHVTLGEPFLEPGQTKFRASATRSKVYDSPFNDGLGMQVEGAEFDWPLCPLKDGTVEDFSTLTAKRPSGGYTAQLMDPAQEHSFFLAWSPRHQLAFGYAWKRADFPWLGRWEENHLRASPPWNSREFTLGMEFSVSPMAESRRRMVERGKLFATPGFFWARAQTRHSVRYCAFLRPAATLPNSVQWDGGRQITLL